MAPMIASSSRAVGLTSSNGARAATTSHSPGRTRIPSSQLYTSKPDGMDVTQIGPYAGAFNLGWSPNGDRLAFSATLEPATESGLFTASPDGSDLTPIGARAPGVRYLWSPDGTRIAYAYYTRSIVDPEAAIFTSAPCALMSGKRTTRVSRW